MRLIAGLILTLSAAGPAEAAGRARRSGRSLSLPASVLGSPAFSSRLSLTGPLNRPMLGGDDAIAPLHLLSQPQKDSSSGGKPDATPGSTGSRLGGLFDGSNWRAARDFIEDAVRRENRESAANAVGYLLAVRDSHYLPSLSRDQTAAAIKLMREFRLAIGQQGADPGMKLRLAASEGDSKRKVALVAAQIRGIEKKGFQANDDPSATDAKEQHILGLSVTGRRSIENFHLDARDAAATARGLIDLDPYRTTHMLRTLYAASNMAFWGAAPAFLFLGAEWWPYAAAVHTVATEPYAVFKHRLGRDGFHRKASSRLEAFLNGPSRWMFDSKTYNLEAMLIESALKYGRSEAALYGPLANQDYSASTGFYGRLMRRFGPYPAGTSAGVAGAGGKANSPAWNDQRKGIWLSIDRLLWRPKAGEEPVMAFMIRTQTTRPKFPKPVKESLFDAVMSNINEAIEDLRPKAPVPIPVTVPGGRRPR